MLNTVFRDAVGTGASELRPDASAVEPDDSSRCVDLLAAESIRNGRFSGAAAEKEVRSDARDAPVPGGPGASKTLCFPLFLKNEIHLGSASRICVRKY